MKNILNIVLILAVLCSVTFFLISNILDNQKTYEISLVLDDMTPLVDFLQEQEIRELSRFEMWLYEENIHFGRINTVRRYDTSTIIENFQFDSQHIRFSFKEEIAKNSDIHHFFETNKTFSPNTLGKVLKPSNLMDLKEIYGETERYTFFFQGNFSIECINRQVMYNNKVIILHNDLLEKDFRSEVLQYDILYPAFAFVGEGTDGFINLIIVE